MSYPSKLVVLFSTGSQLFSLTELRLLPLVDFDFVGCIDGIRALCLFSLLRLFFSSLCCYARVFLLTFGLIDLEKLAVVECGSDYQKNFDELSIKFSVTAVGREDLSLTAVVTDI